jgi:hypothetical protein
MWRGEHNDDSRRLSIELALARHSGGYESDGGDGASDQSDDDQSDHEAEGANGYAARPDGDDEDDSDDEMMDVLQQPRGKPEAMAARLASASRAQERYNELEDEPEIVAQPAEDMEVDAQAEEVPEETSHVASQPKKKKKRAPTPKKSKGASSNPAFPTMDDPVTPISDAEYENLEQVMIQFCRVPLLAEFSRPVSLLHPEVRFSNHEICCQPYNHIQHAHLTLTLVLCSLWEYIQRLWTVLSTWERSAGRFAVDSTITCEMSASMPGASLRTVSSTIHTTATRMPFHPSFR